MRCCRGTFVFCPNKRSVEVQYNNLELGSVFDVLQPSFIPSNQDIKINISPGKKKTKALKTCGSLLFGGPFTGACLKGTQ